MTRVSRDDVASRLPLGDIRTSHPKTFSGRRSRDLMSANPEPVSDDLRRVAAAHGVATDYRNERREPVHVDADVVIKTLGLLDVDARTPAAHQQELARLAESKHAPTRSRPPSRFASTEAPTRCPGLPCW